MDVEVCNRVGRSFIAQSHKRKERKSDNTSFSSSRSTTPIGFNLFGTSMSSYTDAIRVSAFPRTISTWLKVVLNHGHSVHMRCSSSRFPLSISAFKAVPTLQLRKMRCYVSSHWFRTYPSQTGTWSRTCVLKCAKSDSSVTIDRANITRQRSTE